MKFIGRKRELDVLEKFWSKDGYDLGVVYGRRRIGKSFLLKHFSEGKRAVMLQATTNEKSNLKDLASQISVLFSPSASVVCVLEDLKRKSLLVLPSHCDKEYYLVSKSGFTTALVDIASTDTKVYLIKGRDIFAPDGE